MSREINSRVLLLSTSQMESTLCFLDGIIRADNTAIKTYKMVLGTRVGIYPEVYPDHVVDEVITFIGLQGINFILVSLIEFSLKRAIGLLQEIRRRCDVVVVAGGPYAIEYPDDCISNPFIDVVNYTHGLFVPKIIADYPLLSTVPNIIYKSNGLVVRNPPKHIRYEMDEMPLPSWELDNEYMLYNESWWSPDGIDDTHLIWLGESGGAFPVEHHQVPARHTGVLIVSVGCPINTCEFCSISRMYQKNIALSNELPVENNKRRLRKVSWYSPENIIRTVESFIEARPKTKYILFNDNDFASIPVEYVNEFCEKYRQRIGLPFYCQSSPHLTVARGKKFLDKLVGAGLDTYCIGAESSEGINKDMYRRGGGDRIIYRAMDLLNKYSVANKIYIAVDFINGNAAETRENLTGTINLIRGLPIPWDMAIHNLTLNSKTELAEMIRTGSDLDDSGELKIETSDYHHVTFENFLPLLEPYLNVVLEWLGGFHDKNNIGCLKRNLSECMQLKAFKELQKTDETFKNLMQKKLSVIIDTYDFLLDDDIYNYFSANHTMLRYLFKNLPSIQYRYHRPDRYEYDWGFISDYPSAMVLS